MKTEEIKNDFYNLYNNLKQKKKILYIIRSEKFKYIINYIENKYPMLKDKKYTLGMKIYWMTHGIDDFPKCVECGKPNKTHRCDIGGYRTLFCSRKCAHGNITNEKIKQTCLKKYGVDNPGKSETIKEKRKITNIKKYGCENVFQNKDIIRKSENTKKEIYNDSKYTNPEKRKHTNIQKYGCENPFGNEDIKSKIRKTNLEKYGNEVASKSNLVRNKISEKSLKYAVHNSYTNYLMCNPYSTPCFSEDEYMSIRNKKHEFQFQCKKCGQIYESRVHYGNIRRCPKCYPSVTTSSKEQELVDFIKSIYKGTVDRKNRTILNGKEIDIYIPEKKIAIEFDGLYWHSDLNGISRDYHLTKTNICENIGITMIHIFEDEWDNKQNIVKSRIKNILGIYDKKFFARKCNVKILDSNITSDFVNANHIQGNVFASVNIGLFYNKELISVMTFCKPRIALGRSKSEYEWELLRFCSKTGYHVIGGAGKLLSYFEKTYTPKSIITYADRRWSTGKLYYALGFKELHRSKPNYWYLQNGCDKRFHRYQFRKSELKKKLKIYDEKKTEYENMIANKYTRIYDCGNIVFGKIY